jgi:predicted negative regulator of RcsB-dependent stress response
MDERQRQIRESAGLEESRLNQDFIDALRKWGPTVLMLLAVAAGVYWGWDKYKKHEVAKINDAFHQFETLTNTRDNSTVSPQSLIAVANDFQGVKAVAPLARLAAADAYLRAVRDGVKLGAAVDPQTGALTNKDDVLTDADRQDYLSKGAALYQQVVDANAANSDKAALAIQGQFGLAAVAESKGDFEQAKTRYEQAASAAEKVGFTANVKVAKDRIAKLPTLASPPKLFAEADLPKLPEPPPPPALPTPTAPPGVIIAPIPAPPGAPTQQPVTPQADPGATPPPAPAPAPADAPKPAEPLPAPSSPPAPPTPPK